MTGIGSEKRVGYKLFSKFIPPFSYPASEWCFRVTTACNAFEPSINYDSPEVSKVLLPLIIATLPVNMLRVAPLTPLSKLIEWLEEYDKPATSLESSLASNRIPMGVKPGVGMGKILRKAFEAQLDGELETLEDGLIWIKESICE